MNLSSSTDMYKKKAKMKERRAENRTRWNQEWIRVQQFFHFARSLAVQRRERAREMSITFLPRNPIQQLSEREDESIFRIMYFLDKISSDGRTKWGEIS